MNIVAAISETEINNSCICILRGITESMNLHGHYKNLEESSSAESVFERGDSAQISIGVTHLESPKEPHHPSLLSIHTPSKEGFSSSL